MANNITIKDGSATSVVLKSTDNAGVQTPHHNVDSLPALPAGTNNIGDVDVLSLPALVAGSAIIGQVGIDQTTPGTTNKVAIGTDGTVAIGSALPAGTNLLGNVGIDQTTDGTTNKVQARNATHGNFQVNATMQINDADVAVGVPVPVQSPAFVSSASQTRPNNTTPAYDALDVVGTDPGANMEFAGIGNIQAGCVFITGATLRIDVAAIPSGMSSFRLHLYNAAPTAIADKGAFNLIEADRAKYLGSIELPTPVDLGDTLWTEVNNVNKKIKLAAASTTIYGVLQTVGTYTPAASTVKTVTIMGVQC